VAEEAEAARSLVTRVVACAEKTACGAGGFGDSKPSWKMSLIV
jgi:hypothetical protein